MLVRDDTEPSGEQFHRDYDLMSVEELRLELQTADERIVELGNQQEITDLFPQIESLQNEVHLLTEENERLRDQLRHGNNDKDDIVTESIIEKTDIPPPLPSGQDNEQIKILEDELTSLQLQLKTANESNCHLQVALESERSRLESEKAKRQMNISDADTAQRENQKLKEENEKLEKELAEMKESQKKMRAESKRKSACLEDELKRAQLQVEMQDANQNANEGLNAMLAQERSKHERVANKLKENTASLNSMKETLEHVSKENAKLKQSLVESQTTMDTMVSQADLGIKAQRVQKKLKEQITTLTTALQQSEDEKIKLRKEFVRKQQKTDEMIGQQGRWQEKEKVYLADIKKLKNEIRQLKEAIKTTDNSYLKAQVEELTISNGVLKEMVRSANINVRVAIAKGKAHRTESESTLHNQTKSIAMKQTPTKKVFHKDTLGESPQRVDVIRDRDQKWTSSPSTGNCPPSATPVRSESGLQNSKEGDGFALPPASPPPPLPPSAPTSPKESDRSVTRKSSSRGVSVSQQSATPTSQKGSLAGRESSCGSASQFQSPSSRKATDGGKVSQFESDIGSVDDTSASNSPTGSSSRAQSSAEVTANNSPTAADAKTDNATAKEGDGNEDGNSDESDYCDDVSVPSPRRISAVDVVDDDYDDEIPPERPKEVNRTSAPKNTTAGNNSIKTTPKQKVPIRQKSTSIPRRTSYPRKSKQRS